MGFRSTALQKLLKKWFNTDVNQKFSLTSSHSKDILLEINLWSRCWFFRPQNLKWEFCQTAFSLRFLDCHINLLKNPLGWGNSWSQGEFQITLLCSLLCSTALGRVNSMHDNFYVFRGKGATHEYYHHGSKQNTPAPSRPMAAAAVAATPLLPPIREMNCRKSYQLMNFVASNHVPYYLPYTHHVACVCVSKCFWVKKICQWILWDQKENF